MNWLKKAHRRHELWDQLLVRVLTAVLALGAGVVFAAGAHLLGWW